MRGITGGTWCTSVGGCPNFQICTGCLAKSFAPLGLNRFLQRAHNIPGDQPIICSFNPAHHNSLPYIKPYAKAIDQVSGPVSHPTSEIGPRSRLARRTYSNRHWYGYGDLLVCLSCWISFCLSSDLLSITSGLIVPIQNKFIKDQRMCSLYYPRMRQKWQDTCSTGNPGDIITFSRIRMNVYARTLLQIKMMLKTREI